MPSTTDTTWTTCTAKAILLVRTLVGWVFLSEGIPKFLFPDALGIGRFVKMGIPWPQVMAPFVGIVEIACGTLHEARTEVSMLLGLIFLLLVGGGSLAVDARLVWGRRESNA